MFGIENLKDDVKRYPVTPFIFRGYDSDVETSVRINIHKGDEIKNDVSTVLKKDDRDLQREQMDVHYPIFKSKMLAAMKSISIESGFDYLYEEVFHEYYQTNPYYSILMLQRFLREYYTNTNMVKAVLHLISHYTYDEVGELLDMMVLALVNHDDKGIRKFALKVFDNWDSIATLELLKGTKTIHERWLNDYKNKIIKHLEEKKVNAILYTRDKS